MYRSLKCLQIALDMYIKSTRRYTPNFLRGADRVLASYAGYDWEKFKNEKPITNSKVGDYDRIPIMKTENYSIFLIRWFPYSCTTIHRHTTAGCVYKIMEGSILEQRFKATVDDLNYSKPSKLKYLPIRELKTNMTQYIDTNEYHRIFKNLLYDSEPLSMKNSYSLHVYENTGSKYFLNRNNK